MLVDLVHQLPSQCLVNSLIGNNLGDYATVSFPLIVTGERPKRSAFGGALPRFRTYHIGVEDFPNPGRHQLVLGPAGAGGKGVRLASLSLNLAE
jgi:hypothetical protein